MIDAEPSQANELEDILGKGNWTPIGVQSVGAALLKVQKAAPKLAKDARNPYSGNRYVSLETLVATVLPLLNKHGLVLLQQPTSLNGVPALRTRIIHPASGEQIEDTMLLAEATNDPQGQESALTNARRDAILSTLGLVADEDDAGDAATGPPRRTR